MRNCFKIVIFIIINFKAVSTSACQCKYEFSEFTPYYLTQFNHIFTAEIISCDSIQDTLGYRTLIYSSKTIETFWGETSDTITLRQSGMCDFQFEVGEKYLIYGNGENSFQISKCSPTRFWDVNKALDFYNQIPIFQLVDVTINSQDTKISRDSLTNYLRETYANEISILMKVASINSGVLTTNFTNGKISAKFYLHKSKFIRQGTFYLANGKIKSSGQFKNGRKEGKWEEYEYYFYEDKNVYVKWDASYSKNERTGRWTGRVISGNIKHFKDYFPENLILKF